MAFMSLALPYTSQRSLHLLHVFQHGAQQPLKPHNLHRLHRLGYQIDWQAINGSESALLTIPPRRSVYRDIVEQDVGTRQDDHIIHWADEWTLISRKMFNPYLHDTNAWSAATLRFQTDISDICLEFRNLNEVGKIKGPRV